MLPALPTFAVDVLSAPGLFPWLGAAVVPLVIHLWSRRRYREMSWAAMEYLLAAVRRSRRRLQIEQLLLLLVRTLLIVLVVIALWLSTKRLGRFVLAPGEPTHRVLVIDGSYSMGYKPGEKSRFQRAKELAAQIVEESPQGDGFTLVLMSGPPRVVVANPVFEKGDFLPEIDNLALEHTIADLPATLGAVEHVLIDARGEHPRLTREEIYFITDLGRVGWLVDPKDAGARAEFLERSRRLALPSVGHGDAPPNGQARLVVIDVGQEGAENLAVTALEPDEAFATVGRNVNVEAELKNFGHEARSRIPVQLVADGRRVAEEHVDLPASGEASVGFSHRFVSPGDHTLEVRLEGDQLDVDNHRRLALPVKQFVHVLCVDGRPSGEPFGGATGYLVTALMPEDDSTGRGLVRAEVVPESRLLEIDLEDYNCLFLSNVAQFTSSEARALDAYLRKGGSLVFFLGDQVIAGRYNVELAGDFPSPGDGNPLPNGQERVRVLPARLGQIVDVPEYRLDPLSYSHPIVRGFQDHERAGLLTTPVEKHFKLILPGMSKAKVALALQGGDPLIVEEPIHRGRVVLFATSADDSWTPMPKLPSYLPLVREALFYAIGEQLEGRNVEVGDSLGATESADAADVPLVIQRPDGLREPVKPRTEAGFSTWSYSDTGISGVYIAEFGPPISRCDAFAVNVNTVESDLTRITPEELRDQVWPGVPFIHQTTWQDLEEEPVGRISRPSALPKALLYAVLAMLLMETLLAWRFGHHSSG